jgi:hypothetical protein
MIRKQISACVQKTFQFLDRHKSLLTKSAELFLYFFLQLKIKKKYLRMSKYLLNATFKKK